MTATKRGRCVNLGACDKALNNEVIEIPEGDDFVCSNKDCGRPLQPIVEGPRSRKPYLIGGISVGALAIAALCWAFWPHGMSTGGDHTNLPKENQQPLTATAESVAASAPPVLACGLNPAQVPNLNRLLIYLKQGMSYALNNRYELALGEFQQVEIIDPTFLGIHNDIAGAQIKLRRYAEAKGEVEKELRLADCLNGLSDGDLQKFGYMLEVGQQANPGPQRARTMRLRIKQARAAAHYNMACVDSSEGNVDASLGELQHAVDSGFSDRRALRSDPDLARVRSKAGFRQMLASIGTGGPS